MWLISNVNQIFCLLINTDKSLVKHTHTRPHVLFISTHHVGFFLLILLIYDKWPKSLMSGSRTYVNDDSYHVSCLVVCTAPQESWFLFTCCCCFDTTKNGNNSFSWPFRCMRYFRKPDGVKSDDNPPLNPFLEWLLFACVLRNGHEMSHIL